MDIDWSKAPEGATHVALTGGIGGHCCWYKIMDAGFCFCYSDDNEWSEGRGVPGHYPRYERPQEWTGEGLPPVGTVVTIETGGLRIWEEAEQFVGPNVEVVSTFKLTNTDMVVVYLEEENVCCVFRAKMCRPIRTPKQIAEESRELAIKDLMQVDDVYYQQAADIYDRGYRKFEIVEGEPPESAKELLDQDVLMYGTSFALNNDDGTITRLDPTKIVVRGRALKMAEG